MPDHAAAMTPKEAAELLGAASATLRAEVAALPAAALSWHPALLPGLRASAGRRVPMRCPQVLNRTYRWGCSCCCHFHHHQPDSPRANHLFFGLS